MSLLELVKKKLNKLKVPYDSVTLSPNPKKKIRVVINGKSVDFGAQGSVTFLEGSTEKKKNAYIARHSKKLLKDGRRAIDVMYSPAWFSMHVLWI